MLRFNWIQRQEYYQGRRQVDGQTEDLARRAERCCMAIVSSWCDIADASPAMRVCDAQTVSLSRVTSETLVNSCQFPLRGRCTLFRLPVLNGRKERATVGQYGLNLTGLHVAYNGQDNGLRPRKGKRISQTWPKFGLGAATRPHEAGIPSNRLSSIIDISAKRLY